MTQERKHNHYFKDVSNLTTIDVYRVLQLFNVTDPCIQHAVKKLLVAGGRGAGKDITKDVKEAVDSLNRWTEMRGEEVPTPVTLMKEVLGPVQTIQRHRTKAEIELAGGELLDCIGKEMRICRLIMETDPSYRARIRLAFDRKTNTAMLQAEAEQFIKGPDIKFHYVSTDRLRGMVAPEVIPNSVKLVDLAVHSFALDGEPSICARIAYLPSGRVITSTKMNTLAANFEAALTMLGKELERETKGRDTLQP
jgi:hypothetical protein